MDRRLGDAELLGGRSDGSPVFDDVLGHLAGPFFYVPFHSGNNSPLLASCGSIWAVFFLYERGQELACPIP